MKLKKKKGNALMLLMAMILMITVMGATMTTAIAYTDKQNHRVKIEEDLLYAAESGLEYEITRLRAKEIIIPEPPRKYENILPNSIFGLETEVKVSIIKDGDRFKITSIASKGGKSKIVNATINIERNFIPSTNRIFRYTLCAEKVNINCGGPLDPQATRWNVTDIDNSELWMNTASTPQPAKFREIENADFVIPTFINFEAVSRVPQVEGTSISVENLDGKPGVETIDYSTKGLKIYLVNLTEGGELHLKGESINNAVVITNGKIIIDDNSPVVLTHSTILAKEIEFKIASFHATYTLTQNVHPYLGFDKLDETNISEIDNMIGAFCPNWNNSTGSEGDEQFELGDIVYN